MEAEVGDPVVVADQFGETLSVLGVPNSNGLVAGAGGEEVADLAGGELVGGLALAALLLALLLALVLGRLASRLQVFLHLLYAVQRRHLRDFQLRLLHHSLPLLIQ